MRLVACVLLTACTSNAEIAARYGDALAIEYHCLDASPEAVERALTAADAASERRIAERSAVGDEEGAFAAALARVDLWTTARACGAAALAINSVWQRAMEQRARAKRTMLAAWDRAQLDGSRTPKQQWKAIERAREWHENDPELSARAASLRVKLQRTVRVVGGCARCKPLVDAVTAQIVERRSPLVRISNDADASLTLQLDVEAALEREPWHEVTSSEASTAVTVYDRFNEPEKNAKGDSVKKTVSVRYFIDEESSRASVKTTATLQGEKLPRILRNEKRDRKRRWRWSGDERALPSEASDPASPLTPPEALLQQIIDDFARQIADDVLKKEEES